MVTVKYKKSSMNKCFKKKKLIPAANQFTPAANQITPAANQFNPAANQLIISFHQLTKIWTGLYFINNF
jgi:hypothetical protein